jgi:transposase
LRELVAAARVPESWIPPAQVLEIRTAVRLYHDLMTDRAAWLHRIHATLFHQGAVAQSELLRGDRDRLHNSELLSAEGKAAVQSILRVVETLDAEINRIRQQLQRFASRQPGCKELQKEYGIGKLTSVIIWSEIGDCRRFSSSDGAVRHSGLDVTVYSSNGKRSAPHLSRQGQPLLRWALYEAGRCGARPTSPDHDYWQQFAARVGRKRAGISVGRKITRRAHHRLRALGDEAFAEV